MIMPRARHGWKPHVSWRIAITPHRVLKLRNRHGLLRWPRWKTSFGGGSVQSATSILGLTSSHMHHRHRATGLRRHGAPIGCDYYSKFLRDKILGVRKEYPIIICRILVNPCLIRGIHRDELFLGSIFGRLFLSTSPVAKPHTLLSWQELSRQQKLQTAKHASPDQSIP